MRWRRNHMEETFEINTPGIDVQAIVATIRERVEEKKRDGVYDQYNISPAVALEIDNLKTDADYLNYYLDTIWRAADIDLGDFPIYSKAPIVGRPVVLLKKIIWKLLKFYTFRLFSQQKDFNVKMASIVHGLEMKYEQRFAALEEKLAPPVLTLKNNDEGEPGEGDNF